MGSVRVADRAEYKAALEAYESAAARLAALSPIALSATDMLAVLDRREAVARADAAVDHRLIGRLVGECDPRELGARSMTEVLAVRLRISRSEANRRIAEARDLAPRVAITGEPLEPVLPATAAGVTDGRVGGEHVAVIRKFFRHVPAFVSAETRTIVERSLADAACGLIPEDVRNLAVQLLAVLDQDGTLSDGDRARRRGIRFGKQGFDGMSTISGLIDPELRATFEAVLAKLAAPGMCNPDEGSPQVDGDPDQGQVDRDLRSPEQRAHDAVKTALRALLASGKLGSFKGLPATIVVTTTLAELESAAGHAVTAGGTELPMADVIRLARHSHHYLAVFDNHREVPLYLGRSRRIASPGQRLVLYAKDRGCTKPGCTAPGYRCEVHHAVSDWTDGGQTNIDELTLACKPDHRLLAPGGWQTRKRDDGRTEWIPPPHLDTGGPRVNNYHHPERLLRDKGDDDNGDDDKGDDEVP